MLTLTVTKGSLNTPETIAVIERAEHGGYADAAGQFDDAPALVCTVWPGDDLASVGTLAATWADAELAMLQIAFTPAVIDALDEGRYRATVTVAETDALIAEFILTVEPGPTTREPRPVYCAYRDLLDERPWLGEMADELNDETGFAEIRAEARDWTEFEILRRVPRCSRDTYTAALADPGMTLDTPNGRRIVKANVYYSLGKILGRGLSRSSNDALAADAERYAALATETLASCRAEFTGLHSIAIGGVIAARLTR